MPKELKDILIVEDDVDVVKMYEAMFKSFTEYSTVTAMSGEKVLKLLDTYKFRLGIIDIRLSGEENGVDVALVLKEKCPDMVLFAVTGLFTIFDQYDPSLAGFSEYFRKPTEFSNLISKVKEVLD